MAICRDAFPPLEPSAAARQTRTDDEFRSKMNDADIFKYLTWDENEGLSVPAIMAADLTKVPWIRPPSFEAQSPEYFARGAVYDSDALVVRPDHRRSVTAGLMLEATDEGEGR